MDKSFGQKEKLLGEAARELKLARVQNRHGFVVSVDHSIRRARQLLADALAIDEVKNG